MTISRLLRPSLQLGLRPSRHNSAALTSINSSNYNYCNYNDRRRPFSSHASPHSDNFVSGSSSLYIEAMLERYEADPDSVPESWRHYFQTVNNDGTANDSAALSFQQPTILVSTSHAKSPPATSAGLPSDSLGVAHLIRAYQVNGHRSANLDPLGMHANESFPYRPGNARSPDDLDVSTSDGRMLAKTLTVGFHGFDVHSDMDRELNFKGVHSGGNKGFLEDLTSMPGKVTLRKVVERLQQTYCGTIGVEYMHIGSVEQCNWIRERVEHPSFLSTDTDKKIHLFERLCFADYFETFLANKFNTSKRFGLDGGEAIIPALKDAIDRASELGAHSFIIGMPHRGRLNVLANVMRKPMTTIFSEFMGTHYEVGKYTKMKEDWGSSGDVKVS